MLRRFGWMHWLLGLGRTLKRIHLDEASVARILAAHQKGPIVYVLLHESSVDYLALNRVLNERRLPLSIWANGVSHFWWQPVKDALKDTLWRIRARFARRPAINPVSSGWLAQQILRKQPVTVCLDNVAGQRTDFGQSDPISAVIRAQRTTPNRIQLLPIIVVWNRAPDKSTHPVLSFLQSGGEEPGNLARLYNLLFRSRKAFVRVGDPVDLPILIQRVPDARQTRSLRILLRRFLKRESKVVRGPSLISRPNMMRLVLDNPPMRQLARQESLATGHSEERIRRKMEKEFYSIAAHFRWWIVPMLDIVLRPLWTRVYSGVDTPPADMERIREAMRKGSIVLVPCHKSHFDYVLLSWVFYDHKLIIPHIVAGSNLALPGLAWFLRSAGAFFIKRSFTGERIHPAVFSRYLRELTRHGYPVEFYIEGGRTRSGKLLPPKLGVLSMVLDAASIRPSGQEVTLLPISLTYNRVAEQDAYTREQSGASKRKETLGQFAKATSIVRHRYGRVYLRVGEPILCSEIVDGDSESPEWGQLERLEKRQQLQHIGEQILHRIGRCSVVLPATILSLGILAHHRRGIRHSVLMDRMRRFHAFLLRANAPHAFHQDQFDEAILLALQRLESQGAIQSAEHNEERVWLVSVDARMELEFHKNHGLHYFSTAGYASMAIRSIRTQSFERDDLIPLFRALTWLLRYEFILSPDQSATELLEEGIEALVNHKALSSTDEGYTVEDTHALAEIHALFRSVAEGYLLVLQDSPERKSEACTRQDLTLRLINKRDQSLEQGQITRPEALSQVTLNNAIKSFLESGILEQDDKQRVYANPERRNEAISLLTPMVR